METPVLRDRLCTLFEEHAEVQLAYLFGSQVTGRTGPLSDVDVGVLVRREAASPRLRDDLAHAIQRRLDGAPPVDLVLLNDAPVELAYAVIAQGSTLYERSRAVRVEYEAYVLGRYGDYLPVLRSFRRDILQPQKNGSRVQRYRTALERTLRKVGSA